MIKTGTWVEKVGQHHKATLTACICSVSHPPAVSPKDVNTYLTGSHVATPHGVGGLAEIRSFFAFQLAERIHHDGLGCESRRNKVVIS